MPFKFLYFELCKNNVKMGLFYEWKLIYNLLTVLIAYYF
jgi:hypothetical protein